MEFYPTLEKACLVVFGTLPTIREKVLSADYVDLWFAVNGLGNSFNRGVICSARVKEHQVSVIMHDAYAYCVKKGYVPTAVKSQNMYPIDQDMAKTSLRVLSYRMDELKTEIEMLLPWLEEEKTGPRNKFLKEAYNKANVQYERLLNNPKL